MGAFMHGCMDARTYGFTFAPSGALALAERDAQIAERKADKEHREMVTAATWTSGVSD